MSQSKKPSEWLRWDRTVELLKAVEASRENDISLAGIPAIRVGKGGNDPSTYVSWELIYAYAMWVSPEFHVKVIQTFHKVQMDEREKLQNDAALYQALSMSSTDMLISEAALTLGVKRHRLFSHLSDTLMWIYKRGAKWWPSQKAVEDGFVARRLHSYTDESGQHRSYQAVITERGLTKVQSATYLLAA